MNISVKLNIQCCREQSTMVYHFTNGDRGRLITKRELVGYKDAVDVLCTTMKAKISGKR